MLCAGSASAQSTWTNIAGGDWNDAANWNTAFVPLVAGDSVFFPNLGTAYDVVCNANPSIDSVTLGSDFDRLLIESGRTLRIVTSGGVVNQGTIVINETGSVFNTSLIYDAATNFTALAGTGHVELNGPGDPSDARLIVEAGATLALSQPVVGAGNINALGTINSDSPITANVSGSDLRVDGNTFNQISNGSLQGTGGGLINVSAVTVSGGQFLGGVEMSSGATLSGVTLSGTNGLRSSQTGNIAAGGLINNGTLNINTTNSVFNSILQSSAPTTIDGAGTIELTGAGDRSDAQLLATTGNPIIVENAQIILGNGVIRAIDAPIAFRGIALGNLAGEDLSLEGVFNFGGLGRTQSAGGIVLLRNATVTSGLFQGSTDTFGTSAITDCTNSSTLRIRNNSTLNMQSTLVNNGSIIVNHDGAVFNAALTATANTAITGAGTISLNMNSDVFDAQLNVDVGNVLDIGSAQEINGGGVVNALGLINMSGNYNASVAGKDLRIQGAHDLSTGGTAQGTGGGIAVFNNADITGGTFLGGVETASTTTMRGFTNNGTFGIRSNSTLIVDGPITNNDTITINTAGTVFNARLEATAPVTIDGTIVLNGASDAGDAELRANETAGGSINLPATSTITGNIGRINGPVDARGTLSPGVDDLTAGTFHLQQDITLFGTSTVVLDFEETDSVVSFDKITGTSDLILDGTIELRLQGGFEPAIGDTFTIVDAGTVTGVFATTNTPLIGTHLFRVIENAGDVTALWTCLGDVNLDGMLTPADFSAWIAAFNSGNLEVGDQNLDGMLTPTDFSAWIANFNAGC